MVRLSRFTVSWPRRDGTVLIFNTLTRAIAILEQSAWYEVERSPCGSSTPATGELARLGILVEDSVDELAVFKHWLNKQTYGSSSYFPIVLTTWACNLACPYCCQAAVADKSAHLTVDMAGQIADWIIAEAEARHSDRISLTFYGGEPLLNPQPIEPICKRLEQWKSVNPHRDLAYFLVSNGYLLTPDRAVWLADLGVNRAMITVDGAKSVHDRRRVLKNGEGTYDRILENIEGMASSFSLIVVNVNLDSDNAASIPGLLSDLERRGLKDAVQMNYGLTSPTHAHQAHCGLCLGSFAGGLVMADAVRQTLGQGFKVIDSVMGGPCPRETDYCVVIGPEGDLYKCISSVGHPHFKLGYISDDSFHIESRAAQHQTVALWDSDQCRACQYLPICRAGCLHRVHVASSDLRSHECWREFYDNHLRETIELTYELHPSLRAVG